MSYYGIRAFLVSYPIFAVPSSPYPYILLGFRDIALLALDVRV